MLNRDVRRKAGDDRREIFIRAIVGDHDLEPCRITLPDREAVKAARQFLDAVIARNDDRDLKFGGNGARPPESVSISDGVMIANPLVVRAPRC